MRGGKPGLPKDGMVAYRIRTRIKKKSERARLQVKAHQAKSLTATALPDPDRLKTIKKSGNKSKTTKTQATEAETAVTTVVEGPDSESAFFADKDAEGCIRINLRYIDNFLRWDCGRVLLEMGLFPNAKEISESVACLEAVTTRLDLPLTCTDTVAIVIGDGRTPRTAALLAMRTKWARIISIDPALHGLETEGISAAPTEAKMRREGMLSAGSSSGKARVAMRERVVGIHRLEVLGCRIQDATVTVEAHQRVVIILPHAHVSPDEAIASIQIKRAASTRAVESEQEGGYVAPRSLSLVQLPCCNYLWHKEALGQGPDAEFNDSRIGTPCRLVRVWKDVASEYLAWRIRGGKPGLPKDGMVAYRTRIKTERKRARLQVKAHQASAAAALELRS